MRITKRTLPFFGILFFACVVLLFSLWDVVYREQWLERVIALYGILFVLTVLFLVSAKHKKPALSSTAEEFEKSLKGALHHFKCPSCGGIFAIKKSRHNNKKTFSLTCPDCGAAGLISSKPAVVVEDIPEKKSAHKNFTCQTCGEWIMVWAEGKDLIPNIRVYSCPYCGTKQDLRLT